MRKLMTQRTLIHDILFVPAKVPILKIKFKHPYQKLEVDMNINNVPGIYNSYLIHYYSRFFLNLILIGYLIFDYW